VGLPHGKHNRARLTSLRRCARQSFSTAMVLGGVGVALVVRGEAASKPCARRHEGPCFMATRCPTSAVCDDAGLAERSARVSVVVSVDGRKGSISVEGHANPAAPKCEAG
jgi:hypothetical protein